MKNFIICFLFSSLLLTAETYYFAQNNKITPGRIFTIPATVQDSIPPDDYGMRDLTSLELSKEMIPGWNVGNSLDAIGGETNWGNPKISQRLIDSVQEAGFNSIRIPVAWSKFTDEENFIIDINWLIRVEQVVNYIIGNDMYAIINIHWDGGWMQPTYEDQEYVSNRLAIMWEQIAVFFRDYDDHLLFAGSNEVMVDGDYGTPTEEYYTVQNGYNQIFVNTVRSTGGCNHYRHLLVQGFNTNIEHTRRFFVMPEDVVENKLMVEVHYYDPYNFTINANSNITQWGKNATDPQRTETWANEAWADAQFQKMKTKFIDKGIGVVLGEYGVLSRTDLGSDELNEEFESYRRYYMEYVTNSMVNHGLVPMVWDNGGTGNHGMGLFVRSTGEQYFPDIIQAIVSAKDTTTTTGAGINNAGSFPSSFVLKQNYPNPFNPSTIITYSLNRPDHINLSVYDALGRKVAEVVDEAKSKGSYSVKFNASSLSTGRNLSSGIYFYQLTGSDFSQTRKMILMR